jgi:two-component system LytT family response regulator
MILKGTLPLISSRNLGEYESLLTPEMGFLRVHHNVIINMHEVLRYIRGEGGNVIMSDGEKVDVSRRKKAELMDWIEKKGL